MRLLAIARREWASFFRTSSGWVVTALYLLLSGFFFAFATLRPGEPASLRAFFSVSQWILLIVAPAISMRLIAEERRAGTMEALMTAPVSDWTLVIGKYLGGLAFLLTIFVPTLLYVGLLEMVADPDYGPVLAGYLGLALVGMLYMAAGTMFSAVTENQVVALLSTIFLFLGIEIASTQGARLLGPPMDRALLSISVLGRLGDLAKGVVDTGDVAAMVAASVFFIVLAVVAVESRRWR